MRHSVHSIFIDQALSHEEGERFDQALALLYQVHRWAPHDPNLWERMGVLSFLLTDREWLRRSGKDASHLADMGAVNAALYLDRAVALDDENPRRHFWQGWVRHVLYQDPEGARAALARAIALDARHPYAHAALGRMEMHIGERGYEGRAIAHLDQAIERLPEAARFHYDMGACLAGLEDRSAAREAFERALACRPLPGGDGATGAYLAREFHGDGKTLKGTIETLYGDVMEG